MQEEITLEKQSETEEASDWAGFSAEQLLRAYAPEDAIYDQIMVVESASRSSFSLSRIHFRHALRRLLTTDFTDSTDGKPVNSYPCNPWFNFFLCAFAPLR